MRIARLLSLVLAILAAGLLIAPAAAAEPPFRLPDSGHRQRGCAVRLRAQRRSSEAVDKLYNDKRIQLWVVYVDSFSGQSAVNWARNHDERTAISATTTRCWRSPPRTGRSRFDVPSDDHRRHLDTGRRHPPQRHRTGTAPERLGRCRGGGGQRAQHVDARTGSGISWFGLLVVLAIIVVAVLLLWLWMRRRRRKRREAEFEAAKRVDPTDPNALAAVPIDALDDLSKSIVVDVDNAVRTSDSELALAVEEFGTAQTEPFSRAVANAKTTLAQAFNVRQILDDAVPETQQQRRDLLTRVVVAAAKADRELDAQSEAFETAARSGDQRPEPAGRADPADGRPHRPDRPVGAGAGGAAHPIRRRRTVFGRRQRRDGQAAAGLRRPEHHQRPQPGGPARPGIRSGLVDAIRAAESALGQARTLLDAVDSAATDINRAVATLPSAIADTQTGIDQAGAQLQQANTPQAAELTAAREAAVTAIADAQKHRQPRIRWAPSPG